MRKKTNLKLGVSLITLIITIVVIIILAAAVILTLGDNNPIESANKASFLSSISNFKDELNLYNTNMLSKTLGEYDSSKLNADTSKVEYTGSGSATASNIYDILTSLQGSKYDGKVIIENGKLLVLGNKLNQNELEWVKNNDISIKGIEISTAEELAKIGVDDSYPLREVYELKNDIDLSEVCSASLGNWTPIGSGGNPFTGIFDGKNYKVENIYINTDQRFQALFAFNDGIIKNVILFSGQISSAYFDNITTGSTSGNISACISGIVAYQENGIVENCKNYTNITASGDLCSGIVAYNISGKVTNCENNGEIKILTEGEYGCAGIVGRSNKNIIENCINNGRVEGTQQVGGIVGNCGSVSSVIVSCINNGEIIGTNYAGGIVGAAWNTDETVEYKIIKCYNSGNVTSITASGGITGLNTQIIENCYNAGKITASNIAGGITGFSGQLTTSYNKI